MGKDNPQTPMFITYIPGNENDTVEMPTVPCNEQYDVSFAMALHFSKLEFLFSYKKTFTFRVNHPLAVVLIVH